MLDWLRSEGVPLRFDRSFWQAKFSGSTGTQLVAALRFLGLLQDDRPLPDLESLVDAATDERRFILKELLKDSYATVPFDELDRATPAMVRRWFRAYPVDGHTLPQSHIVLCECGTRGGHANVQRGPEDGKEQDVASGATCGAEGPAPLERRFSRSRETAAEAGPHRGGPGVESDQR